MRKDFLFGIIVGTVISAGLLAVFIFTDSGGAAQSRAASNGQNVSGSGVVPLRSSENGHLPEGRQDLLERLEQFRQRPEETQNDTQQPSEPPQPPRLPQQPEPEPEPAPRQQIYTVVSGDTLSGISMKFYGTSTKWQVILDANRDKLRNPAGLKPGMELVIPPRQD